MVLKDGKKEIGYKLLWASLSVEEESVDFIRQNDVGQSQKNWRQLENNEQTAK